MDTENEYFEIEPFDQYKSDEAKLRSSLKWLFTKAYCNSVPLKYQEPYFEENELGKSLRNDILNILTSGYLYCETCKNIFTEHDVVYDNVESVFQMLSRNGILVTDDNDEAVTSGIISKQSPFYVNAHIALIDSLMLAYSTRAMKLELVVNAVRKYTKFSASAELPTNLDQICLLWLNKISQTFLFTIDSECDLYSKQLNIKCQPHVHLQQINDLTTDLSNGAILAALILFYTCNTEFDLSDVCLQETISFEESLENLNICKEFCDKYIGSKPFYFNYEDFLYSPAKFKLNKIAFIAELFYWFEVKPLDCCKKFNDFKEYIKNYAKKHYHATKPFISSPKISDIRNSFIKSNSPPPLQKSNEPLQSLNGQSNVNSFNSLLDQVSLDASHNLDNNNANKYENEQFSSRTYVKYSHNNSVKQSAANENEMYDRGLSTSTTAQPQPQVATSNSTTYTYNGVTIQSETLPPTKEQELFYKYANINQLSVNNNNNNNNNTNNNTNGNIINNNNNHNDLIINKTTTKTTGLSVTAYPGDIFYKVKDVTESESTDTLDNYLTTTKQHSPKSTSSFNNNYNHHESTINNQQQQKQQNINNLSPNQPVTTWKRQAKVVQNPTTDPTTSATLNTSNNSPNTTLTTNNCTDDNKQTRIDNDAPIIAKELHSIRQAMEARRLNMILNNSIRMQLEEKKRAMERDKRRLELDMEKQRQNIGKQAFLQVVQQQKKLNSTPSTPQPPLTQQQQQTTHGTIVKSHTFSTNNKDEKLIIEDIEASSSTTSNSPIPPNEQQQQQSPPLTQQQPHHNSSPNIPNTLLQINSNRHKSPSTYLDRIRDNSPRKQWDKSQKQIDLNNSTTVTNSVNSSITNLTTTQQTPTKSSHNKRAQNVDVDLTKPYYTREEMMRILEANKQNNNNNNNVDIESTNSDNSTLNVKSMLKDVDNIGNKLLEIENNLINMPSTTTTNGSTTTIRQSSSVLKVTTIPPLNNNDSSSISSKLSSTTTASSQQNYGTSLTFNTTNAKDDLNDNHHNNNYNDDDTADANGAFFISFGNEAPLRAKPILTEKKVSLNGGVKTPQKKQMFNINITENEFITTTTTTNNFNLNEMIDKQCDNMNKNFLIADDDESEREMEKRKELIIQRQIERRQQLEAIRIKREEERARLAEEQRLKDEEQSIKKQLERTRKDAIFQAYLEKKKRMQDETGGILGKPLKSKIKSSNSHRHLNTLQQQPQQQLQAVDFDHNDLNTERTHISKISNYNSDHKRSMSAPNKSPKLYKRITGKSNKLTIINSLNQLVLAGKVNTDLRNKVIEEIEASDARHFVILFRDYHLQYRGIYSYLAETDYIEKIIGQGPQKISEDMIEKYYKYNSGAKQFSPVPTKHFSVQCDAVTIQNHYWQARKPSNASTLLTSPMSSNHGTLIRK